MLDPTDPKVQELMAFIGDLRETYINGSDQSTLAAAQEFDKVMQPVFTARVQQIEREQAAGQPTQAEMLMEMILEVEQVVSMVPPRLARYRELLAAEGLDKTVVARVGPDGRPSDPEGAEGGREGLPGINLADQASLEFHSQLLQLALAIAQDEVQTRMRRRSEGDLDDPRTTL